ncbi:MAG: NUDIX domain-containing protein [Candidatus Saccharimonadales bacterium]
MSEDRAAIYRQLEAIEPLDELERQDKEWALEWVNNESNIYQLQPPDVPTQHLVAYCLIIDPSTQRILLLNNRPTGRWLPIGAHVAPKSDPRDTVSRIFAEQFGDKPKLPEAPAFIAKEETSNTVGKHIDVSLWYLVEFPEVETQKGDKTGSFTVQWWEINQILTSPAEQFHPQFSRVARKLRHLWHEGF